MGWRVLLAACLVACVAAEHGRGLLQTTANATSTTAGTNPVKVANSGGVVPVTQFALIVVFLSISIIMICGAFWYMFIKATDVDCDCCSRREMNTSASNNVSMLDYNNTPSSPAVSSPYGAGARNESVNDDDMRAAISASLADSKPSSGGNLPPPAPSLPAPNPVTAPAAPTTPRTAQQFFVMLSPYHAQERLRWPKEGKHVMAQVRDTRIILYLVQPKGTFPSVTAGVTVPFIQKKPTTFVDFETNFALAAHKCHFGTTDDLVAVWVNLATFHQILSTGVQATATPTSDCVIHWQWDKDLVTGGKMGRKVMVLSVRRTALALLQQNTLTFQNMTMLASSIQNNLNDQSADGLRTPAEESVQVVDSVKGEASASDESDLPTYEDSVEPTASGAATAAPAVLGGGAISNSLSDSD